MKGLEIGKRYNLLTRWGFAASDEVTVLREFRSNIYTHILLERKISEQEIEKELYRRFPEKDGFGNILKKNIKTRIRCRDIIKWALSLPEKEVGNG